VHADAPVKHGDEQPHTAEGGLVHGPHHHRGVRVRKRAEENAAGQHVLQRRADNGAALLAGKLADRAPHSKGSEPVQRARQQQEQPQAAERRRHEPRGDFGQRRDHNQSVLETGPQNLRIDDFLHRDNNKRRPRKVCGGPRNLHHPVLRVPRGQA
jgi:hypothetical protein